MTRTQFIPEGDMCVKTDNIYDTIIVGGGPAGYTCALYCGRAGRSVLVIERRCPGGQISETNMVYNYPGFESGISGIELGEKFKKSAEAFAAVTVVEEVQSLDLDGKIKVVHTDENMYLARSIVIATGASHKRVNLVDSSNGAPIPINYCATCDGALYAGGTVVVIGGGDSAVSEAMYLAGLCQTVILIHRRDKLRAAESLVHKAARNKNLEFILDSKVLAAREDREGRLALLIEVGPEKQTREIYCDGVFAAIGMTPETDLVKAVLDLDETGYICADETTRTNLDGVFVIGDVRTKPLRQVVTAVSDGAVCSRFIDEYLSKE